MDMNISLLNDDALVDLIYFDSDSEDDVFDNTEDIRRQASTTCYPIK